MLRIVLLGRTGNNMFQYALGRVLAKKHGVPLILDASWFNGNGWAEVSHFLNLPLQAQVIRRWSVGARTLLKITGKHYWEYRGVPILRESTHDQSFNSNFLDAPDDCMLFGYFQTPLYFESIAAELRTELNELFRGAFQIGFGHDTRSPVARASWPQSLIHTLAEESSVAVHVRRGDYLHHLAFAVCDNSYYHHSMHEMRSRLPKARFFIFSDDPDWCRNEFRHADVVVVDSGVSAGNPLHDLHLMSLASHHIIANSSYSWWAAWLGDKPDQQVIMPDRWYAHGTKAPIEEKRWKK